MNLSDFPLSQRRRIRKQILELAAHLPAWMLTLERGSETVIERGLVYAVAVERMEAAARGGWKVTLSLAMGSLEEIFKSDE